MRGVLLSSRTIESPAVDERDVSDRPPPPIHFPRPPALSHGFVSLAWGVALGAYVWVGLLAVGVSQGTSVLFGIIAAVLIFFYVRLYGDDPLRRRRSS